MSKLFLPRITFQSISRGIVLSIILLAFSSTAFAATRTISDAGGSWDATGTWVEGAVPTSADDVAATATSGNVTINAAAAARSINLTNYTGTLTHNSGITLSLGDGTAGASNVALKFVAGMTYTLGSVTTSAIEFVSTSATVQTVDFAGKTTGNVTYNASSNGSWQLTGTHNTGTTATVTLTKGTLDTNSQTVSWGIFNCSNSNVRTLTMGASAITITGTYGAWACYTSTNMTRTANTATITMTGSSAQFQAGNTGTVDWNGLSLVMSGGGSMQINGGKYANVTLTGTTAKTDNLAFVNNPTVSTTLTLNGNSATNRLLVRSHTFGTARTLTITGATVSASNVDFRDITLSVSTDLSAITGNSGDAGGNSGITFTTAADQHWISASGGNWSDATKWTSRVPLPQDNVFFDNAFSASQTVTADMPRLGRSIDWTGASGTPTFSLTSTPTTMYGSLTLISGMTLTQSGASNSLTFEGRGSFTLTSAGKTFGFIYPSVIMQMVGGTLTLQDAVNFGGNLTFDRGTFVSNGYNVQFTTLDNSSVTTTRTLNITNSTVTATASATGVSFGIPLTGTNGFTFVSTGSTIVLSGAGSGTVRFEGGGNTFNDLSITGGGSGSVTVFDSNTFNTFTINAPKTVTFTAGTTQTVSSFVAAGSSGNVITLNSSSAGTAATLSDTSGTNALSYCSIQDITASGGARWRAFNNCTNVSGNSGWKFKRGLMMVK